MIDVDIRLEADVIVKDFLLSKFKSFKISTIIGKTYATELDSCGDSIARESKSPKYPNAFKIIAIDTNNDRLQVLVNPISDQIQYMVSLDELNFTLGEDLILDKVDEVVVEEFIQNNYK